MCEWRLWERSPACGRRREHFRRPRGDGWRWPPGRRLRRICAILDGGPIVQNTGLHRCKDGSNSRIPVIAEQVGCFSRCELRIRKLTRNDMRPCWRERLRCPLIERIPGHGFLRARFEFPLCCLACTSYLRGRGRQASTSGMKDTSDSRRNRTPKSRKADGGNDVSSGLCSLIAPQFTHPLNIRSELKPNGMPETARWRLIVRRRLRHITTHHSELV
jgi:hypothetical protein